MNAKRKGNRAEHRSMALLESAGYHCCRSAASLGCWDVVAVGTTDIVLVQVKSNNWPSGGEMGTLQNFACPPNCRKLIHRWKDRTTTPGREAIMTKPASIEHGAYEVIIEAIQDILHRPALTARECAACMTLFHALEYLKGEN